MKELNFKSISEFHEYSGVSEPENPLFSVSYSENLGKNSEGCETKPEAISLTCDFFNISLKNIVSGNVVYGRTKYDCTKGTMLFTAPNQTLVFNDVVFSSEAYHISFHKDYLNGHPLFEKIKKYNFFSYHVNEALHLSPKEEKLLKTLFQNIITEYENNQDEFSKEIILSHLDTLLRYSDRFYKRQFLNRKDLNEGLFFRFKAILNDYFEANKFEEQGMPSLDWMAEKLGVSHRYMSDTLKAETGKTAIDQINLFVIEEAKNMLLAPNASISETAYKLGFVYPQYFSRLFKKKTGLSPKGFVEMNQN